MKVTRLKKRAADTAPVAPRQAYEGSIALSDDPPVAIIDDFLSPEECAAIVRRAAAGMKRAKVSLDDRSTIVPGRSGENCWLRYADDPQVRDIGERVAAVVGIPLAHAESLQVLRYATAEEYRPHYDAYDLTSPRGQRCCRRGGQRMVTALLYLNDVEEGGGTAFPKLDVEVSPRRGRLVIFNNTRPGELKAHPGSLHAGLPVLRGEKWAANLWFHARPMSEVQNFDTWDIWAPAARRRSARAAATRSGAARGGAAGSIRLHVNRAKPIFESALATARSGYPDAAPPVTFVYWDTYGGKSLDIPPTPGRRIVRLIDRRITNSLGDKRNLARLLKTNRLAHLAPPTFETVQEAQAYSDHREMVWFVKSVFGTAGRDMYCLRGDGLDSLSLKENQILQAGVENLDLIDGRKFTIRMYCVVWNGAVYLYDGGFLLTHGFPYEKGSTDYAVQIDHRGYDRDHSPVELMPLADFEHRDAVLARVQACVRDLGPILERTRSASGVDAYTVLGMDFLRLDDGSVKLLEINTMPNFIHRQVRGKEVMERVNVPFWAAVLKTILGAGDASAELIEVQPESLTRAAGG
ncbi:2OG-Fe(II) oxygenase [Thioalkalivibrio thiocyanodenitrificans]|uniref:2OG-Fe(II) oxygenase n=1 Tax=Thioalkalivibrio thiocyanodenitrificans TaxID=243063 RepID=UPI0003A80FEA|nr:2OG-Fe(II) oxygenase [Thioalkalivibrio thiocyanodenitrificans]